MIPIVSIEVSRALHVILLAHHRRAQVYHGKEIANTTFSLLYKIQKIPKMTPKNKNTKNIQIHYTCCKRGGRAPKLSYFRGNLNIFIVFHRFS